MNTNEEAYLALGRQILQNGTVRRNRTGIDTISWLCPSELQLDLEQGFPLLTTRRIFFRGVVEEKLWFLRGQTNATILSQKGVKIWDANTSAKFQKRRVETGGPDIYPLATGDCGAIYGFQWRHSGANYVDCHTDYTGQGTDQIANLLQWLDADEDSPVSRRMVVSAWNPSDLRKMCLTPCHHQFQVFKHDGKLSGAVSMRSCDFVLGLPFNIASYACLFHMLSHCKGLGVGRLKFSFGDLHIYQNHVDKFKTIQLARTPLAPPTLTIAPDAPKDLFALDTEHLVLHNYQAHPRLDYEMAV